MCDVAGQGMLTSAFMSLGGGIVSGNQQKQAADFNATQLQRRAQEELVAGNDAALIRQNQTKQLIGQQNAALGANNVQGGSGTAAALVSDTARIGAADEAIIRNNAARNAWGYNEQAKQERYQGQTQRFNNVAGGFSTALLSSSKAYGIYKR